MQNDMQSEQENILDENMCEVEIPFSHNERMNSPRILECQKDIAIYSQCETSLPFSNSIFLS